MTRAILSAALAIACVAGASAQARPDFTGTWEMDRARSDKYAGGAPAKIAVEGSKMTITRTMAGNSASLVYMLDGTPSSNTGCDGCPPMILTSKWEGSVLVTAMGTPQKPGRVEKHSIQDDGTLKIEITVVRDGKSETGVLVFNKAKPDFTGTWKAANSFNTWTIAVEGSKMTVTMTVAGNSDSTVYMLDGTPSKNPIEGPNGVVDRVYTSTWEDNVLVTTITTGGPNPLVERRWLEPDGTMKFNTTIVIQGTPRTSPGQVLKKIG